MAVRKQTQPKRRGSQSAGRDEEADAPPFVDVERYSAFMESFQADCQRFGMSFMAATMEGAKIRQAMMRRGVTFCQVIASVTHLRRKTSRE